MVTFVSNITCIETFWRIATVFSWKNMIHSPIKNIYWWLSLYFVVTSLHLCLHLLSLYDWFVFIISDPKLYSNVLIGIPNLGSSSHLNAVLLVSSCNLLYLIQSLNFYTFFLHWLWIFSRLFYTMNVLLKLLYSIIQHV